MVPLSWYSIFGSGNWVPTADEYVAYPLQFVLCMRSACPVGTCGRPPKVSPKATVRPAPTGWLDGVGVTDGDLVVARRTASPHATSEQVQVSLRS